MDHGVRAKVMAVAQRFEAESGTPARHGLLTRRRTAAAGAAVVMVGLVASAARRTPWAALLGRAAESTAEQALQQRQTLLGEQRYGAAADAFGVAVAAHIGSPESYLLRGMAEFNGGQLQESIWDFSQAITLQPRNAVLYLYRGESYLALAERAPAVRDCQRVIDLAPAQPALLAAARAQLRLAEGAK